MLSVVVLATAINAYATVSEEAAKSQYFEEYNEYMMMILTILVSIKKSMMITTLSIMNTMMMIRTILVPISRSMMITNQSIMNTMMMIRTILVPITRSMMITN